MDAAQQKRDWRAVKFEKMRKSKEARMQWQARKRAENYLLHLQTVEFPGKNLLQLLRIIAGNGPVLAGEIAIQKIENDIPNLSPDDRQEIERARAQLAERRS